MTCALFSYFILNCALLVTLPALYDRRTTTLFAWTGRALPMAQWLIYIAYVLFVTLCIHLRWPGYMNSNELKGLAAPLTSMGGALPCLLACCNNWLSCWH